MDSRLRWFVLATLLVVSTLATTAEALEKVPVRWEDPEREADWRRVGTCSVSYYNICTGWVWNWGPWLPGDRFGTYFETCCPAEEASLLQQFIMYFSAGSPAGYGFTGTIQVWPIDGDKCPTGAAIASTPHLPTSGWNYVPFTPAPTVPSEFAVLYELNLTATDPDPVEVYTDHPSTAAATCYPGRLHHSFAWGTAATPVCPGSVFADTPVNADLLTAVDIECVVSVDRTSWGSIKSLYR